MAAPETVQVLTAGPVMNRLVATLICHATGGLPDDSYPPFSSDVRLAFQAVDAFVATQKNVKLTIEYPKPEVWVKRFDREFGSGWVPAAFVSADTLPAALCTAVLKAAGFLDSEGRYVELP